MNTDPSYEACQPAEWGEDIRCTCGAPYPRGGACSAREPSDPGLRGDVEPEPASRCDAEREAAA